MASLFVPSAKLTLSYPLYACDFDPEDATRLVVGGGGGAGRSGVGNKITLLTSKAAEQLDEEAEIDLSKDEDNVTSLAVGQTQGGLTTIYAGINGNPKDVAKGKNEHFRSFTAPNSQTSSKARSAKINETSRTSLFEQTDKDAYQRVTRLSRPFEGSQLGVIATGLAKTPEAVLFNSALSADGVVNIRGRFELKQEAEDVDVIQVGDEEFLFVCVTKKDMYLKRVSKADDKATEVQHLYTIPGPESINNPPAMSFRSIRFLNSEFALALCNLSGREGSVLQVFRLPTPTQKARIAIQKRLPPQIRQSTGLAITCLSPVASPGELPEAAQFVVAVAGHDTSISLFSLEYRHETGISVLTNFDLRRNLKEVHPLQMTGIALSNFVPPSNDTSAALYVKLASVSMANTIVIHTVPLTTTTEGSKSGKPRYVLDLPVPARSLSFYITSAILVLFLSLCAQAVLEVRDQAPERLGAKKYLSTRQQAFIKPIPGYLGVFEELHNWWSPTPTSSLVPSTATAASASNVALNEVLESLAAARGEHHTIYLREEDAVAGTSSDIPASIKADLHNEEEHGPHGGKTWDQLSEKERHRWVTKLKELGHTAEDLGITVMKGVVFGTIGGAIGAAVG